MLKTKPSTSISNDKDWSDIELIAHAIIIVNENRTAPICTDGVLGDVFTLIFLRKIDISSCQY